MVDALPPYQCDIPGGSSGAHVKAGLPDGAAAVEGPSEGADGPGMNEKMTAG